jgi:hypothetical protein
MDLIAPSHRQIGPVVSLHDLNSEGIILLKQFTRNVLALRSTELTIAQIKDNQAIQGHFHVQQSFAQHQPDIEMRSAPSDSALNFAQKYCQDIDIMDVEIDAQVCSSNGRLPNYQQM